jgi:hypothetical protein
VRVSELTRVKPVEVVAEFGEGETIALTFDRNRITPDWIERGSRRYTMAPALAEAMLSWDLVNDDGSPYELSEANLSVLSYAVQTELLAQVIENAVPSRAEGNVSSASTSTAPSASTPPPASVPNGTVTLPSPTPSESLSPT